ncbi:MAG: flagellar export chaperone FlgN [Succinivibrionaceae bacterium]|jgi:flagella synthesis protein FlgN|nr:flagellar export chaperone FlgN [Succinivibrionaceae bacterium]MDD6545097.1 flagellar export chaperone FlgN [Pseudomonadota bacterium]MDY3144343.1 flagellar export chaperone FlgN [Succinivibrionaceae bacterium]MDY6274784.1 flagellar export chaperone FlgN [Succinivibrionaceae bacterium]MDY6337476.1 flagellar export chaperone FlgN [Succinivibrionaceae bacterium]
MTEQNRPAQGQLRLEDLVARQQELLRLMLKLLKDELELLKNRKAESLPAISRQKVDVLNQIRQIDQAMGSHPEVARLKGDLQEERRKISQLLEECQNQNAVNGRLIEMQLASNRRLSSMLSKLRDRSSMTYDKSGLSHSGGATRFDISC